LVATETNLPLGWDEGEAIERAEQAAQWWGTVPQRGLRETLSPEALRTGWPFAQVREGHPALNGWLMLPAWWGRDDALPSRGALRMGEMLLFSLAAGVSVWRLGREFSLVAAWGAAAALATSPRLLAHAHFTTWDGPLTAAWLLAWGTFPRDWESSKIARRCIGFGIVLGVLLSAKFTGWLAVGSFGAWLLVYQRRAIGKFLVGCLPLALATFVVLNPSLWREPLSGVLEFWRLNLDRRGQGGLNISTQFFGRMYNLDYPAPWYSAWLWVGMVVPLPHLVLGMGTFGEWWHERSRRPAMALVAFQMLAPLLARMAPGVPAHDAERLILPSLAFAAILAGIGTDGLWRAVASWRHSSAARAGLVALLLAPLTSVWWYWPQGLSYYNLAVGGLRGATALGCEATYYWDGLGTEALDWLAEGTSPDQGVAFGAAPAANLRCLQRWQKIPQVVGADDPRAQWYVVQMRPSAWSAVDRWLIAEKEPAFETMIRSHKDGLGPWRLDVPLLRIYSGDDLRAAQRAMQ
jgi:4-amino-4-deoxy-L-arabinose transferase-like glycosyltransferase